MGAWNARNSEKKNIIFLLKVFKHWIAPWLYHHRKRAFFRRCIVTLSAFLYRDNTIMSSPPVENFNTSIMAHTILYMRKNSEKKEAMSDRRKTNFYAFFFFLFCSPPAAKINPMLIMMTCL